MAPPPPPPSEDTTTFAMAPTAGLVTPPQKHKTPHHGYGYGYGYRRGTASSSPATSHASSAASPSQLHKARSTGDVLASPRLRGSRMDPYPRYSPRKRLSADFSDGTYSADSGADSPKSEKGGWRIHAAVAGPFLTGPLAKDFAARLEELRSPRGKKIDEPDLDHNGLLLFPIVPDFVAPAITPEVFQASIHQPAPTALAQPQPEPDHSAAAASPAQSDACYYPPNTDQYYAPPPSSTPAVPESSWDAAAAQQQPEQYGYGEQQYAAHQHQQYYNYGTGYEQQQHYNNEVYAAAEYNYQDTYEHYPAGAEQLSASTASAVDAFSADAFPPLPTQHVATPEVDSSVSSAVNEETAAASSNQAAKSAVTPSDNVVAPGSPVRRQRAPSYADIVTGAAHTTPAVVEPEAPKTEEAPKVKTATAATAAAPTKVTFATFDQLSDGIAESMSRILAKSNGKHTHAEVEFSCLIHRIQTQLKLMGRVSTSLHLKQMKTLHKLQKTEIEKLSIESSNMDLLARVKKYEQEQAELKKQLAEALEAKDVRLKDAVDQLGAKIDSLKNSTDASTSSLASEIDAIRKCTSPDDLEKRVEEIGQVLDYLIENQSEAAPKNGVAPPRKGRSGKFEPRRQSVGSWKAIALYAIVVWAASLCGVWVGVKYAGNMHHAPAVMQSVVQPTTVNVPVATVDVPVVDSTPAVVDEVVADVAQDEVREVVVETEQPASIDLVESVIEPVAEEFIATVSAEESAVEAVVPAETTVEEPAEAVEEPAEAVEEVAIPSKIPVADATPGIVFTLEQMARPSPSCFTCASDHSTVASFFCEMLSEVMSGTAASVEEPSTVEGDVVANEVEPIVDVEVAETPVADVITEIFADTVQTDSISENWNLIVVPDVEDVTTAEEKVETTEVPVVTYEVVQPAAGEPVVSEVVEEVATAETFQRRPVTNMMSSPLVHALYVWCPSLFDMHAEETETVSALNDLARALTSLSSQILSDHSPSSVEEVTEEPEAFVVSAVEEVEEPVVDRVEDEISKIAEAAELEPVVEVVAEEPAVEVAAEAEPVVEVIAEEPAVESVAEVEPASAPVVEVLPEEVTVETPVEEVAVVEEAEVLAVAEVVEVEALASNLVEAPSLSHRWASEQFLINVGVMSGTAEVVVADPTEAAVASADVEEVPSMPVWALSDEAPALVAEEKATFSNSSSIAEIVPAVVAVDEAVVEAASAVEADVVAPVEVEAAVAVKSPAAETELAATIAAVEQTVSSCPLQRCPLFETALVKEPKFMNASMVSVEPTLQLVEDSAAAVGVINDTIGGSSPAVDLKALLLNSF